MPYEKATAQYDSIEYNNVDAILRSIDEVSRTQDPQMQARLTELRRNLTNYQRASRREFNIAKRTDLLAVQADFTKASTQAYDSAALMCDYALESAMNNPDTPSELVHMGGLLSTFASKLQHNRGFMPTLVRQMAEHPDTPEGLKRIQDSLNGKTVDECLSQVNMRILSTQAAGKGEDAEMDGDRPRLMQKNKDATKGALSTVMQTKIDGKRHFVKIGHLYQRNLLEQISKDSKTKYDKVRQERDKKHGIIKEKVKAENTAAIELINADPNISEAQKLTLIQAATKETSQKYTKEWNEAQSKYDKFFKENTKRLNKKYPDFAAYTMEQRLGMASDDGFKMLMQNPQGVFEKADMMITDNALRDQGSYIVSKMLGFDCIVPTQLAMDDKGRYVSVMDGAQGKEASKCTFVDDDEAKKRLLEAGVPQDMIFDLRDGKLQKAFQELALVDMISGQRDRHMNNYFIHRLPDGNYKFSGIDNDFSFGEETIVTDINSEIQHQTKLEKDRLDNQGNLYGALSTEMYAGIGVLSPEMAEKINNINKEDMMNALSGIVDTGEKGESRLNMLGKRIDQIKEYARDPDYSVPEYGEHSYHAALQYHRFGDDGKHDYYMGDLKNKANASPFQVAAKCAEQFNGKDSASNVKSALDMIYGTTNKKEREKNINANKLANKEAIEKLEERIKNKTQDAAKNEAKSIEYNVHSRVTREPVNIARGDYFLNRNAATAQNAPKQPAPTQTAPKQTAPKQSAPKQTAPTQPAPKQPAPTQTAPKQTAPKQTAPQPAAEAKASGQWTKSQGTRESITLDELRPDSAQREGRTSKAPMAATHRQPQAEAPKAAAHRQQAEAPKANTGAKTK